MTTAQTPLAGIRVLDIGTMLAGPWAAAMLADQGAEVFKIEAPGIGDVMRYVGPTRNGVSALFHSVNRGKRSLALDLKSAEGREVIHRLAAHTDVLIHNFRPGVAERLGVDYATLAAINPALVYVSVSGFGHSGPMADRPAYDNVIQAFTGVALSQAHAETGEPTQYYQIFADKITAMYAAQAISVALLARERGAGGQELRLAMVDAVASFMWPDVGGMALFREEGASPGLAVAKHVPLIKCRNGHAQAAPLNDAQFHGWCAAFGVDSSDPDVRTVADRNRHGDKLQALAAAIYANARGMDVDEVVARLEAADVPCAKAHSLDELPAHPQMQANGLFVESEHPVAGRLLEPRSPVRFGGTPTGCGFPSAALGQHSDEILRELGFDANTVAGWREKGVIG